MIRRLAVLLSLATVLAIPSLAHATTVTLSDYSGIDSHFTDNAPGGGGPFTATTSGGGTLGDTSFITFCIEFNEHFSYGATYDYTLSDGAVAGGVSGGNPDLVDDATKWLYAEVFTGGYLSIAAFGPFDAGVGARVQEAIWNIEGERGDTDIDPASKALANYALLNQNWNTSAWAGYAVYAMNLTNSDGSGSGPVGDDDPCT